MLHILIDAFGGFITFLLLTFLLLFLLKRTYVYYKVLSITEAANIEDGLYLLVLLQDSSFLMPYPS